MPSGRWSRRIRLRRALPGSCSLRAPQSLSRSWGWSSGTWGPRLGSAATAGEGTQNLLCAYLAAAVLAGLLANTLLGLWWLDGAVALAISAWAVAEGWRTWAGRGCGTVVP